MADGDVVFNDAEIQRIANSPAMQSEIQTVMNLIIARARSIAPVRTGEYINSFRTEIKLHRQLRAVGFIINTDEKAMALESIYGVQARAKRVR